jgi:hypothetical protein
MDNRMNRVIPIAASAVNWQLYIDTATAWLDHAPSRGVDASSSRLSDFAKYLASLAEFSAKRELDPRATLRAGLPGPQLHHLHFSVMVCEKHAVILQIAEAAGLSVMSAPTGKERAAVISGTLAAWRDAVIVFCSKEARPDLRELFNEVKRMFDHIGLGDIWHTYKRRGLPDKTYYLEYKP